MNLSTALRFRERVSAVQKDRECHDQWQTMRVHLQDIMDVMVDSVPLMAELAGVVTGADRAMCDLDNHIRSVMQYLDDQINGQRQQYLQQSESIYAENQERLHAIMNDNTKSMETYWQNRMAILDEETAMIRSHISMYDDWRLPGLMLGPGLSNWIEHMVALDPLYLVDSNLDMLVPAARRFHKVYQRRLRRYTCQERGPDILPGLPRRQLGLVFAHDFFSIKPVDMIERYLAAVFDLLRDGGACIFTYVDGDHPVGAELVEKRMACYVPAQSIRNICARLGYDTVLEYHSPRGWNCCEIRRPGKISSLRGGQALATIVPIV